MLFRERIHSSTFPPFLFLTSPLFPLPPLPPLPRYQHKQTTTSRSHHKKKKTQSKAKMAPFSYPRPKHHPPDDTKQRVNRCMIKLSDRDTESMAVSELESLARSLSPDSLPAFLAAVSDTRPTDKTPLRRHSLRLLSLLSISQPASSLLPHLPKMLSIVLRRVRDPDSSVRSACVDAVRSLAASSPNSVPSILLPQLSDALLHEQDQWAQMSSALCLAAAIDSASGPDLSRHLQRLLPRLLKLARSNAFKAKPALISLLGSVAAAGGAGGNQNLLAMLVTCLMEFLASEDWSTRKAAADALTRTGVAEKNFVSEHRDSCVTKFESCRFDKVKIVRDSMNRMLEVWKDLPAPTPEDSGRDSVSNGRDSMASTARKSKITIERKVHTPNKCSDWKVDSNFSHGSSEVDGHERAKFETKRMVFDEDKRGKMGVGLKSAWRVVPVEEPGDSEVIGGSDTGVDEHCGGIKDGDLSLIQKQLVQIGNQQSSLLDLLQRFIGSSQNGIRCLETRVHGLEMTLDGISRDLAVPSGRMSNKIDPELKTCCSLPSAEFLSSRFRKITEGDRYSLSSNPTEKQGGDSYRERVTLQGGFVNLLAEIDPQPIRRMTKNAIHDTGIK